MASRNYPTEEELKIIRMNHAVSEILRGLGEDCLREGLSDTPKRHVKMLKEFTNPPAFSFTTFKNEGGSDMLIVKDIPFYSFCEHHIIPFFGTGAIAYIPGDKIVGLSKLPRVLDAFSRRLQNQERITHQVMEYLNKNLSADVAVVLEARHLCVEMRGVEKPGTITVSSAMSGRFKADVNCRQEFLRLIGK